LGNVTMLLLGETSSGFALVKVRDGSLVEESPEAVAAKLASAEQAKKLLSLKAWKGFSDIKEATEEVQCVQQGKIGKVLKSFLKKAFKKDKPALCVWEKGLASAIKKKFDVPVVVNSSSHELFRGLRAHLDVVMSEVDGDKTQAPLAQALSRFKFKFSPEKVDIMVMQCVGLLEDLDKEANNLAMRLKEWYGFHFPELLKIIDNNETFARCVILFGYRNTVQTLKDEQLLEAGLDAEMIALVRAAAETSMGSELVDKDLAAIKSLAERVLALFERRAELVTFLKTRMDTIAPNLTHMVGETLGAKLLSIAGSLMNLAKKPASTVQILGAEKALFRALKAKSATPKYGLIYSAKFVGQANNGVKGKMSRVLANKLALCARADACGETPDTTVAERAISYCQRRLDTLNAESRGQRR